jgi:hypothetical protein
MMVSGTYFINRVRGPLSLLTPLFLKNRPILDTSLRRSRVTSAFCGCFSSALTAGNRCSV